MTTSSSLIIYKMFSTIVNIHLKLAKEASTLEPLDKKSNTKNVKVTFANISDT